MEYQASIDVYDLQKASDIIWKQITALDQRIQQEKPFSLIKEDLEKGKVIIAELVQGLSWIADMLRPFLPTTSEAILVCVAKNEMPATPLFLRK